jgi:hypothetical protein
VRQPQLPLLYVFFREHTKAATAVAALQNDGELHTSNASSDLSGSAIFPHSMIG